VLVVSECNGNGNGGGGRWCEWEDGAGMN